MDEQLPSNCKWCGSKFLESKAEQMHFRYFVLAHGKDAARDEFNQKYEDYHFAHAGGVVKA